MSTPVLDKLPFTLQCLPYGVISTADSEPRCAVAIGDHAIDLLEYAHSGRLEGVSDAYGDVEFDHVFGQVSLRSRISRAENEATHIYLIHVTNEQTQPTLNTFAALDQPIRSAVQAQICKDLENNAVPETCLLGLHEVTQHLPMAMQGFSDFYTSLEHCQNCSGEMAAAKIPKNWFYVRYIFLSLDRELRLLTPALGPFGLQLARLICAAYSQYYSEAVECLLLQRYRLRAHLRSYEASGL
jgi:fumarylacetoacetase